MSGNAAGVLVTLCSCISRVSAIAGACYLATHEHPVMAAWMLVLAFVCGISWSSDEESKRKDNAQGK